MALLSYHISARGLLGFLAYITGSDGTSRGGVIPAYTLVDSTGAEVVALGTASNPSNTQTAALPAGTDRSGTATTTSSNLAAANTARRGLNVQNIGANNIGVNEFGSAAAIGTAGTYTLAPGATMNVRTNRAVTVIAATASTAYTATEF